MDNFIDAPFGVLEITFGGNIVKYNGFFEKNILPSNQNIENITDIIESFDINNIDAEICIKNDTYYISYNKICENYQLFFTKIKNNEKNKTVISLIFIDNYDEVLDSLEEFKHPLLVAIVDGRIKKMAKDFGGVVKRFEKDKYILVLSGDKLNELMETKFDILENIKEIDMGNTIPVTLSIGVGKNGQTYDENMEFARASIDLALSRGGDQVVIKAGENYDFFGGHSKGVMKNSRVRARVKAYGLTELIENATNVLIMGHKNVDLDCIGAGIGMYAIVSSLEKKCNIVLNNVTSSVSSLYEKVITENKYKDAFISSEDALKLINRKTLLVVVDVYKKELVEAPELVDKVKKIVVFDHHRRGTSYIEDAVLVYHEPYASSTCELVTEMLMYMNKTIQIKQIEADAMLAGIIVDTKNLVFKTGIKTFEAAALLKKKGADTVRVKKLFKISFKDFLARTNTVKNMECYKKNIAISVFDEDVENPLLLVAQSSDELLNISEISASFVLCQIDGNVYISARSFGEINVQIIMEELGGGGHQSMSATQIQNVQIDDAISMLKNVINNHINENN